MRQPIQWLLLFSAGMSSIVSVFDPVLITSAFAADGQEAVVAPVPGTMQSSPPTTSTRRLMSELPQLKQLATPSVSLPPPPEPKPAIGVSASSVSLNVQQGDASSAMQSLTVTNIGGGTLSWNATAPAAWLMLGQPSGNNTGTIVLTATAGSLASGTYTTAITLSAAGATPVTIPVNLTVAAAPVPPLIRTNPTSLSLTAESGDSNSSSRTISVSNGGGGRLTWSASENASWVSVSPISGTGNGTMTITATPGSLAAGTYNAVVTVNALNASPVSIPIALTVAAPLPTVALSPSSLTFTGIQGGTNPTGQAVTVNANGNWTARSSASWLTLSAVSGTGTGSVVAKVALASAVVGTNNATITVTSGSVTRTIAVGLTVSAGTLTASPARVAYTATLGAANPAAQTIAITSTGAWTVSESASWLSLASRSGTGNGTITALATTGTLPAGTHNALITVSSTGGAAPVSIPVTFTVASPSPTLTVSPTALTLTGLQGATNPASQAVTVTANGSWTARSSTSWLMLSTSSGTGPGSIIAKVSLASAVVGTHHGTITVTSGNVTRTVAVGITVSAGTLTASPARVTYTATQGAANPAAQTIAITSTGAWTVSESASWLSLASRSGTGNGTITALATTGTLPAGTHNALITVSSTGATPVSIPVTFTVRSPAPTLTVSPTALTLTGSQGGSNPAGQAITVNANGNWTAKSSASWLTLSAVSGTGTGSVMAKVALSSAVVGTNNATITVTSGSVTRTITVGLTVSAGTLTASPARVAYTATKDAANPAAQTIAITSTGAWTVSDGASWLSLSPTSGSSNGTITAKVNTATAVQGNNSATITVKSGGITRTVNVALTLNPPSSSSINLTWNANTERDLAGYRVYRATSSGAYGAPIVTIQGNTTSYLATGLQLGTTYFFVVTAFDIAGNESAYSNEVSKSIF